MPAFPSPLRRGVRGEVPCLQLATLSSGNLLTRPSSQEQESCGEYDPSVSRAYFAVFHAEIAALCERKTFPGGLRFVHSDLIGRRHLADYSEMRTGKLVAERCVRKAKDMIVEIARVLNGELP